MSHTMRAQGLNPDKQLSQYVLESWNTEDGLTSESSNDMLQTKDGYIWIATYTGLHRFDGLNFKIYNSQNSNIPSSNVLAMDIDQNDDLWVGTLHGLAKFNNEVFFTPKALSASNGISIEAMLIDKSNGIWFSSKSNNLFYFQNDSLIDYSGTFISSSSTILSIEEVANGDVFFGTDDSRLWRYSRAQDLMAELKLPLNLNGINTMLVNDQDLLIGSGSGLYTYKNDRLIKQDQIAEISITSLQKGKNDNLWLGTAKGLIRYNFNSGKLDFLTEKNGLPNNIIRKIKFDSDDNLWGGTYRGGIFYMTDGLVTTFSENDGLSSNIISSVSQLADDIFVFGNENGKLDVLKGGKINTYNPKIKLSDDRLKHLLVDSDKVLWVSTYGGLYRIENSMTQTFNTSYGFPDNSIRMVFEDSRRNIWVGTKNAGLVKMSAKGEILDKIGLDEGLSSNYIMSISESQNQTLIVGTISGINYIEQDEVVKILKVGDGLPSNFTFSTLPIEDDLWIASNDGLIYYDMSNKNSPVVFNRKRGMPTEIIYDVLNDDNGNLWMPSENSIIKISLKDLKRSMTENSILKRYDQFDKSNGMKNNHCLGGVLSFKDWDGNFWIPTLEGIVFVNPNLESTYESQARPIIQSVSFNKHSFVSEPIVLVPANTERISFEYTGINYKNTEKLIYRYKLEPFDDDWIYSGKQRNAVYTNLPPGKYEFKLQTGLNDEYYNSSSAQLIEIEASWYETLLARVIFILAIIIIGPYLYFIRVKQLQKRNMRLGALVEDRTAEINKQKDALAKTLKELSTTQEQMVQSEKMASLGVLSAGVAHEINNPLNFIQGGIDALETFDFKDHSASNDIESLITIMKEGVVRAADIVSSLNEFSHQNRGGKQECSLNHIIGNCVLMLKHQLSDGITVQKHFDQSIPTIEGNNGQLHQVFLNVLTNAIHAIDSKGEIILSTKKGKNSITVEIKDTGIGIKPDELSKITEPFFTTKAPGEGTGLGLSIAYNILKDHNSTLRFVSKPNEGTNVIIVFPSHNTGA